MENRKSVHTTVEKIACIEPYLVDCRRLLSNGLTQLPPSGAPVRDEGRR